MKKLTKEEKERIEWFRVCNMEELLEESIKQDWKLATFNSWCLFKIAQNLEELNKIRPK